MTQSVQHRPLHFIQSGRIQARVIGALMIRDALGKFGHENLGFFWVFGEPLLLTSAVMVMWGLMGQGHGAGVGVITFVLSTYSLLTLWRHLISGSVRILHRNADLLFHQNVRFLDILLARAGLDMLGGSAAFTVSYVVLYLLGYVEDIEDPLLMAGAWFAMTWFGLSAGMIVAALTELFEAAEHLVQPVMYITLPVTGSFFMVAWLPGSVQAIVIWSPLVNIFEMFRAGMFGSHITTTWDVLYVLIWCVVQTAIGLPLLRVAQRRMAV